MSWSRNLLRNGFLGLALTSATVLSACTMAPVYSDQQSVAGKLAFTYGEPNSRLEQIVYQDLRLRLGESHASDAREVRVSVSTSYAAQGVSRSDNPNTLRRVNAVIRATILPPPGSIEQPVIITRTATANYTTTTAQAFAAEQSRIEAEERAMRAATESLRLALLAGAVR